MTAELVWAVDDADEESLDVTQCRTRTEKRMSALQHMRQIQAASPLRTIRTVRFLFEIISKMVVGPRDERSYTTLDVRVPRLPTKERRAMVRSMELGLFL